MRNEISWPNFRQCEEILISAMFGIFPSSWSSKTFIFFGLQTTNPSTLEVDGLQTAQTRTRPAME